MLRCKRQSALRSRESQKWTGRIAPIPPSQKSLLQRQPATFPKAPTPIRTPKLKFLRASRKISGTFRSRDLWPKASRPYGNLMESLAAALKRAALTGMPVVRVGRGNAEGFTKPPSATELIISGSNLTATKARLLLMACLMNSAACRRWRIWTIRRKMNSRRSKQN